MCFGLKLWNAWGNLCVGVVLLHEGQLSYCYTWTQSKQLICPYHDLISSHTCVH